MSVFLYGHLYIHNKMVSICKNNKKNHAQITFTFKGWVSLKIQFFAFFFFPIFCVLFVCYHPLDTLSTTSTGQHELMGNTFILHSSFYILNDPVVAYDLSNEQPFSSFLIFFIFFKFFSFFFFFCSDQSS